MPRTASIFLVNYLRIGVMIVRLTCSFWQDLPRAHLFSCATPGRRAWARSAWWREGSRTAWQRQRFHRWYRSRSGTLGCPAPSECRPCQARTRKPPWTTRPEWWGHVVTSQAQNLSGGSNSHKKYYLLFTKLVWNSIIYSQYYN